MNQDATQVVAPIVKQMEDGWNSSDSESFSVLFAEDADFVDPTGDHHHGRQRIHEGHQQVLDILKGSVNQLTLDSARSVADGVIVAHVSALLKVPAGPMAGEIRTTMSLVLVRRGASWPIVSFQNTQYVPEEMRGY